jgi:hypothetical protein
MHGDAPAREVLAFGFRRMVFQMSWHVVEIPEIINNFTW